MDQTLTTPRADDACAWPAAALQPPAAAPGPAFGPARPDAARLTSNRERLRDAWHALAKEACALTAALAASDGALLDALLLELRPAPGGAGGRGSSNAAHRPPPASSSFAAAAAASSPSVAKHEVLERLQALLAVQRKARDLLAGTHPANLPFLADLFTHSVLQVRVARGNH